MKPVNELIDTKEPAWSLVLEWIDEATNQLDILPCDPAKADAALYETQVTTRSPMGAIIHATGGILVDHGWLRILGSGSTMINRSLPQWNLHKSYEKPGDAPTFLLVADDAVGGFWAINGGAFGEDTGNLYYLAPDTLEWEETELNYSEFLHFCFYGDLEEFYGNFRWKGWEKETGVLNGNEVIQFYPFLWTQEGADINSLSRKKIPVEEAYGLLMEARKSLEGE
ncbi:DUF2625 domain-containing protein [Chitinophaga sedimenti]|uniref:DUF2625 domain-containing protein n=1 Tax=Chitinophaga sedimenti TaxID=2033606 RepID=UPI002003671E|nr:DUF2625 domain-containing protein [Chitinophaga sedimenti]MCK7556336.1 DUF2625 domain-containing protein [Chitinophaga sedimenti]